MSADFPLQPFPQEALSLSHCYHRLHWSLPSGLQELSREALGFPCVLNRLSLSRYLAAEGKAAVRWDWSGLSARVLATRWSCTQSLLSSFDGRRDRGREWLLFLQLHKYLKESSQDLSGLLFYFAPGPCASSEVALANLVPGLCPHGVFLKPEDLTASVSLRAEPGFQAGRVSRQVRGRK